MASKMHLILWFLLNFILKYSIIHPNFAIFGHFHSDFGENLSVLSLFSYENTPFLVKISFFGRNSYKNTSFQSKFRHIWPVKFHENLWNLAKVMNHKKCQSEFKNIKNKHGNHLLVSVFHFLQWFYLVHSPRLSWSNAMNQNLNVISNV